MENQRKTEICRLKVLRTKDIKYLIELLDDEPRSFELIIHPPIGRTGTRAVTIKVHCKEDADYFSEILNRLSYD